jgi:hypothetical protein
LLELERFAVALIEFPLFDSIDELLDLVRISGRDVIVVVHRRQPRRSYAWQNRTPRLGRKYFLFHDDSLQEHNVTDRPGEG